MHNGIRSRPSMSSTSPPSALVQARSLISSCCLISCSGCSSEPGARSSSDRSRSWSFSSKSWRHRVAKKKYPRTCRPDGGGGSGQRWLWSVLHAPFRIRRCSQNEARPQDTWQESIGNGRIYDAGFNSNSRFYESANEVLGTTPTSFRDGGANTVIHFAIAECSLVHPGGQERARRLCCPHG